MIKLQKLAVMALTLCALAPLYTQADISIVDFDYDPNGNKIGNADIITNQYRDWGLTISGCNTNGSVALGTDQVNGVCVNPDDVNTQTAFDTLENNTADPDLEFNLVNGQYVSEVKPSTVYEPLTEYKQYYEDLYGSGTQAANSYKSPGNVLIIHERAFECNDVTCGDDPDDEGSRPAGFFVFEFDRPVDILGLDFFDIEVREAQLATPSASLFFHSANGVSQTNVPSLSDGDYTRIAYETMFGITKLVVNMPGSGAINNLVFRHSANNVSAPASILILLVGCGFLIRRKLALN
jgi:hypothetical protein